MTAADPGAALRALLDDGGEGADRAGRSQAATSLKSSTDVREVCGITRLDDADAAVAAGASAIGFVFWPESPRFVDPYRARAIAPTLPPFVTRGWLVREPAG